MDYLNRNPRNRRRGWGGSYNSSVKVIDSGKDEEPDDVEIKVPELNAKDAKSFENVEKIIAGKVFDKMFQWEFKYVDMILMCLCLW